MSRTILHCDMNNFFASVACLLDPSIRGFPVAVCGAPEMRRGIVLAKNRLAAEMGVITGESVLEARGKVPGLQIISPDYPMYLKYSRLAREIYSDYTDNVLSYGLDEAWLDVTESIAIFGDGVAIADEIRRRIREELGLTVSVGVSFNKVFSKLASDMRKPDFTTIISKENYKDLVWKSPVNDLLFVGPAARHKLFISGIITIGDLANSNPFILKKMLGRNGVLLWQFANGNDSNFFPESDSDTLIRSIGNHITPPRNVSRIEDIRLLLLVLADSVGTRLRSNSFSATVVKVYVKDVTFKTREFQCTLKRSTQSSSDIFNEAMSLFSQRYSLSVPVRTIGIRVTGLRNEQHEQLSFFDSAKSRPEVLDLAVDELRRRFGYYSIERAVMLSDRNLSELPVTAEYTVGPKLRKWGDRP